MLEKIASVILVLVGLINIFPVIVFFSPEQTKRLYGIPLEGADLLVLMRHRGVLLSLIGLVLVYAAFKPDFRIAAIIAAFISKIAFIFLIATTEGYSSEIKQVALIDVGAMVLLAVVLGIHFYGK